MASLDVSGDGGCLKKVLEEGSGATPKPGDTVFAHYTGRFQDGSVFDSSIGKPHREEFGFYFTLGQGEVIRGWDVGFGSMKIGEKALLTCRSDYAYGDQGSPGAIPPKATLEFEVQLLNAEKLTPAKRREIDQKALWLCTLSPRTGCIRAHGR